MPKTRCYWHSTLNLIAMIFVIAGEGHAAFPEFLDADIVWTEIESRSGTGTADTVEPVIQFVPGAIFGDISDELPTLPLASVGAGNIAFPLYLLERIANTVSEPLNDSSRGLGITIEPEETRILRIGTFFMTVARDSMYGAGFRERGTDNDLILLYVDQACRITGDISLGGDEFSHQIVFEQDGFHFVRVNAAGKITNADVFTGVEFVSYQ